MASARTIVDRDSGRSNGFAFVDMSTEDKARNAITGLNATFGEHLDFHPHLHALVANGLFARSGLFYVLPDVTGHRQPDSDTFPV